MNELRKQFEVLPEIEERILLNSMKFCEKGNLYYTEVGSYISAAWVTGAWYAFQEQQKKIDAISDSFDSFLSECELWGYDSDHAGRQLEIIQELLK